MTSSAAAIDPLDLLAERLEAALVACGGPVLVAYSGGVDSTVVLKAATRALGSDALGVFAATESTTDEDAALARAVAEKHGFRMEVIAYSELAIENYAENPVNRCYFCKSELHGRLTALARERGFAAVCDGSNLDDGGDWRPGLKAVSEKGVRSPLREAGLDKAAVRALAQWWGLPNHDRPSSPCLSSRIPYGQRVTREKLDQVAAAERFLAGLGLREFRCRHHGDVARLEVKPHQWPTVLERHAEIETELRRLGFQWVAMDLGGFRSGSLNRVLEVGGQTPVAAPRSSQATDGQSDSGARK